MAGSALKALVAEDDLVVRMLMVETLEDCGYDVLEASNGLDAIRLMDEPDSIDFIVTDYHMPGFSGVEVARRARERHPAIPVLFVSARVDILVNAGAPHPFTVLKKPFTMAELGIAVNRLVGHSI
jgi:CheY-like chemotaxis protein